MKTGLNPIQQQSLRSLTPKDEQLHDFRANRDSRFAEAAELARDAVTFPAARKVWSWTKATSGPAAVLGLAAASLALVFDIVASPFRLLGGLRNAAEAAYYSARIGLSKD